MIVYIKNKEKIAKVSYFPFKENLLNINVVLTVITTTGFSNPDVLITFSTLFREVWLSK